MNDYEPTSPLESLPACPVSSATSVPTVARNSGATTPPVPTPLPAPSPDRSASVTTDKRACRSGAWRLLSSRDVGRIAAAAVMCPVIGLSVGLATSTSALAAQLGSGSNARSGPAAGGSSGTVGSVSKSSFTMTTSAGQKVTIDETSFTKYEKGTSSKNTISTGERALVLGTVSSTTIKAAQVIVQTTGGGPAPATAATVIAFQKGAPTTSKQVGQIPASYRQGSGTIVSGTTANKATEAALTAYPGGIVDRVVKLSNGEYEVRNIGVNWPHHVFVNQDFKVVGAE
jgi:hypothetical protein